MLEANATEEIILPNRAAIHHVTRNNCARIRNGSRRDQDKVQACCAEEVSFAYPEVLRKNEFANYYFFAPGPAH
jgi:hypothetical protein